MATIPLRRGQREGVQEVTREAAVSGSLLKERPSFTMTEMELGTEREGPERFVQRNKVLTVHQLTEPHKTSAPHLEYLQVSHSGLRQYLRPVLQMGN